ncbi:hypothetical protein ACWM35_21270 [Neobacillus sp. K501]
MEVLGILVAAAIVIFLEKPNLTKNWNKKETAVFFVSLFFGVSLSIAWALHFELLSIFELIADVYRPILEPFKSYLKQFK